MPLEIEIKLKVGSHDAVRAALKLAKAVFVRTVLETNTFFDRPDRSLRKANTGLRVRMEKVLTGQPKPGDALLTFKGPPQTTGLRSREAFDLTVSPPEQIVPLIAALGFEQVLCFEKRRESWLLGGCHVELDHMPDAGLFVEIEGPSESVIAAVRQTLDLVAANVVHESYSAMMAKLAAAHPDWRGVVRL